MSAGTQMMVDGTSLRVLSVAGAQSRLVELLGDQRPGAGWWVAITRALDDLADSVHTTPGDLLDPTPGDLLDPEGFTEQLRADAPHLIGRWRPRRAVRARTAGGAQRPAPTNATSAATSRPPDRRPRGDAVFVPSGAGR